MYSKNIRKLFFSKALFTALLCITFNAHSATNVNGTITEDTTWDIAGSPYILDSNLTIEAGVSLTIDSGVVVDPASEPLTDKRLLIKGNLIADSVDFNVYVSHLQGSYVEISNNNYIAGLKIEENSSGAASNNIFGNSISIHINTDLSEWDISGNTFGSTKIFIESTSSTIEISGDLTLNPIDGLTDYISYRTLYIPNGSSLTLPATTKMTVNGDLYINGGFNANSAEIYVTESIDIRPGSVVDISSSTFTLSGPYYTRIFIMAGASATISNSVFNGYFFLSPKLIGSESLTLTSNTLAHGSYRLYGGSIDTDVTWPDAGYPYWLTNNVTVQPEVTLTIASGAEVTQSGFTVEGTIQASSATLSSISVVNGGVASLENCNLSSIRIGRGSSAAIDSCTIGPSNTGDSGIAFDARATMTESSFSNINFANPDVDTHFISIRSLETLGGSSIEIDNDAAWTSLDGIPLDVPNITVLENASLAIIDATFSLSNGTSRIEVFGDLSAQSVSGFPAIAMLNSSSVDISNSVFNSWLYLGEGSSGSLTSNTLESYFRIEPFLDPLAWQINGNTYAIESIYLSFSYSESNSVDSYATLAPIDNLTLYEGSSLSISAEGTLRVQPLIEFSPSTRLTIYGRLEAQGVIFNNSVREELGGFVSIKDSEFSDRASLALFSDHNVLIGNNISNISIRHKDNTILANNIKSMQVYGSSALDVHFNNFIDTDNGKVSTFETSLLDATNNYWGHPSGPKNHGGSGTEHSTSAIASAPWSTTPFYDSDLDGLLDRVELENGTNPNSEDSDNDGAIDSVDLFPLNPSEHTDNDLDGIGDNSDPDDDNDGVSDEDEFDAGTNPLDADSTPSTDSTILPSWNRGWRLSLPGRNNP